METQVLRENREEDEGCALEWLPGHVGYEDLEAQCGNIEDDLHGGHCEL